VARTELLPTGGGPPVERTMLMPGGSGGAAVASGGVPRTELLPTGPPSSSARSAVAAPAAPAAAGGAPAARATPRPAKRRGRLTMYLGMLAVLFVLVLAGGGAWWWLARQRAAAAAAAPAPTVAPAAPATAPLQVVAVPWGLASVRTADGAAAAGAPQSPQPTPLLLELPPGRYVVAVSNPALGGGEQRCEVELKAGEPATCHLVLKQWGADDYFASVGWR